MNPIVFDGTHLVWSGHGRFKATSGGSKFQEAKFQDLVDKGPIPEGRYNFLAVVAKGLSELVRSIRGTRG